MDDNLADFIEGQLLRERAAALSGNEYNEDVYKKRLKAGETGYRYIPRIIYFYYVALDPQGALKVAHYWDVIGNRADPRTWDPIDYAALPDRLRALGVNARRELAAQNPAPDGYNFSDIKWERISYVAFLFDEPRWKFHRNDDDISPVIFSTRIKGGKRGTKNHTFFDATDYDLPMPLESGTGTDSRSAIAFINHMKGDEFGNKVDTKQYFHFNLYLKVSFAGGTEAPLTVIFDPGGTNLGPPLEP